MCGKRLKKLDFAIKPEMLWYSVLIEKQTDQGSLKEFKEAVELINEALGERGVVRHRVIALNVVWRPNKFSRVDLYDSLSSKSECPVEVTKKMQETFVTRVNCPELDALNAKELDDE